MALTQIAKWKKLILSSKREDRLKAAADPPARAVFAQVRAGFTTLLGDEDEMVRAEAADVLGWYHQPGAIALLRQRLATEKSLLVKVFLLESLAAAGAAPEINDFQRELRTRDAKLRITAYYGLGLVGLTAGVHELKRSLQRRRDSHNALSRSAAVAHGLLNRIGDALVDIRRFAKNAGTDGERELADTTARAMLAEMNHVLERVQRNEYGVSDLASRDEK